MPQRMQLHGERANTKMDATSILASAWRCSSMIVRAGGLFESRHSRLTSRVEEPKPPPPPPPFFFFFFFFFFLKKKKKKKKKKFFFSAVNSPGQNNSNAPVAGRNSFTEGQAKSKIEDAGYSNVTELKKDDDGVWRGKASKGGSATAVSVDFQGNVKTAK